MNAPHAPSLVASPVMSGAARTVPHAARNGPATPLSDTLTIELAGASYRYVAASHWQACFRCGEPLHPIRKANRIERRQCHACGLIHQPIFGRSTDKPIPWPVQP